MDGVLPKDRIVLLDLHPIWSILLVLGGHIAGRSCLSAVLVLCALKDDLYPISFLSHDAKTIVEWLLGHEGSFLLRLLDGGRDTYPVDGLEC